MYWWFFQFGLLFSFYVLVNFSVVSYYLDLSAAQKIASRNTYV